MTSKAASLPPALTRPRRIVTALGILLLLAAVPVAFGVVTEPVEEETVELPEKFQVPPPGDGDEGIYAVTHHRKTDEGDPGEPIDEASSFRFEHAFHWLPIDGKWVRMHEVREFGGWGCSLNDVFVEGYQSTVFSPEGSVVGAGKGCDHRERPVEEEAEGWGRRVLTNVNRHLELAEHGLAAHECVHRHAFQQTSVPLDDLDGLFQDCYFAIEHLGRSWNVWAEEMEFAAVGVAGEALVVEGVPSVGDVGTRVEWWFLPSLPYPVRVIVEPVDADFVTVYELKGWQPGDLSDGPQPDLRLSTERGPWGLSGPSESGIDHPFPLSEALEAAQDDPESDAYRDYRLAHPDAVVQAAWYRGHHGHDAVHSWSFIFSEGGSDSEGFSVSKRVSRHTPEFLEHHAGLTGPDKEPEYTVDDGAYMRGPEWDEPSQLPAVPSVDHLFRLYRVMTGEEADAWGFEPCGPRCEDGGPLLFVGRMSEKSESRWNESDLLLPSGKEDHRVMDRIVLRPNGTFVAWEMDTLEDRYGPEATADPSEPQEAEFALSALDTTGMVRWRVQTAVAAGSLLTALLVAAVYWLWPVMKVAPAALFSRVKQDKLLENPQRRAIVQAVASDPGVHYREILRRMGLPDGTVRHHLDKLVTGGLVKAVPGRGYTCYYLPGRSDSRTVAAAPALKSPVARELFKAIQGSSNLSSKEAALRLGVSAPTVLHHVKRLEKAGLVRRVRDGRHVRLCTIEEDLGS